MDAFGFHGNFYVCERVILRAAGRQGALNMLHSGEKETPVRSTLKICYLVQHTFLIPFPLQYRLNIFLFLSLSLCLSLSLSLSHSLAHENVDMGGRAHGYIYIHIYIPQHNIYITSWSKVKLTNTLNNNSSANP